MVNQVQRQVLGVAAAGGAFLALPDKRLRERAAKALLYCAHIVLHPARKTVDSAEILLLRHRN